MKLEAAGVDAGKEVLAEPRYDDGERAKAGCDESRQKREAMMKANFEQAAIGPAQRFKPQFEFLLKPDEDVAACGGVFTHPLSAQQILGHGGHDCPRQEVRGQQQIATPAVVSTLSICIVFAPC